MRSGLALAALLILTSPALAQDEVKVEYSTSNAKVAAGGTLDVHADITVKKGWYVYSAKKVKGTVPSLFKVEAKRGLSLVGDVRTPAPSSKTMEHVGTFLIHKGKVRFTQRVRVPQDAQGKQTLPVSFSYLVCSDDGTCVPQDPIKGTVTFEVSQPKPADDPGGDDPLGDPLGGDLGLPGGGKPERVGVDVSVHPARAPPGALVELRFDIEIQDGWHIYATTTPKGLPVELELELPEGFSKAGGLQHPKPQVHVVLGDTYHELKGKLRITQVVQLPQKARGAFELSGVLKWQECDPKTCVDGKRAFGKVKLEIAADAPATGVKAPGKAKATPTPSTTTAKPAPTQTAQSNPLFLIGASFLLGLAMLVMPCTYPMIPITVSIFSKGTTKTRRQTVLRAGAYATGIVLSFLLVGGVVQVVFGAQGQGAVSALATNAWVNLGIGAVFVYFAFSFFGYYELGLPQFLQRFMQLGTAKQASDGTVPMWSLFLMGLFFVLTSYTCGAPVVLGLFAAAAQDPHPLAILGSTFIFACTVAAPFFLLALAPGAIRLMPKSGSWFSVFKVVLAFVELGFAVKFFRGTDLQWEFLNVLTRPVTLVIWTGLAVMAAVYLFGRFPIRFPHDPDLKPFNRRRAGWAVLLLALAGYFGWGLAGNQLAPSVEAFILPDEEPKAEHTIQFVPEGLTYKTDLASLEAAKLKAAEEGPDGRVFVLFTGHNCVNCVQMEKGVLPQKAVREALSKVGRVALFTDVGETEAKHKELMLEKYNKSAAIPAFFVIDGQGQIKSSQIGSIDEAGFLKFLERGGLEVGQAGPTQFLKWGGLFFVLLVFLVLQLLPGRKD